jgi:hypothetical protein
LSFCSGGERRKNKKGGEMITLTVECDNNLIMTVGSAKGRMKITLPNVDENEVLKQIEAQKKRKRTVSK